jgi:hypothetical protein
MMNRGSSKILVILLSATMLVGLALGVAISQLRTPTSSTQSNAMTYRQSTICQNDLDGKVNHLSISRTLSRNELSITFPAKMTITDSAPIRALAEVLCGFPKLRSGLEACPVDLGTRYALQFAVRSPNENVILKTLVVSPTGCESVTGLAPTRWINRPAFWSQFGEVIGLHHATWSTFYGTDG